MIGTAPAFLEFRDIAKRYGAVTAVGDVSLTIRGGEFVALVGQSGSGKSTLLKTVIRLVDPDSGTVLLGGEDVSGLPPHRLRRRIGYVFQGIGLFPHMTVAQNIGVALRIAGERIGEDRLHQLLDLVELERGMAMRMPDALSGGQRQRVGIARALAGAPHLLLMDEPFGALDPLTRDGLSWRIRRLHRDLGLITVFVTHDMAEALLLATRVLVMDRGRIVADERPAALLGGAGGSVAQGLVAVPREQARRLAELAR